MTISVVEKEFLWVEKYRPMTIDECILPERIKSTAKKLIEQGEINNMIFHGSGGVGKTTLAKAICKELECDYIVINGSVDNGIDTLRTKISQFATTVSLNGKPKVVVIDESDGLTHNLQSACRNFFESYSKNCRFIFTCNFKEKIIAPLHSRLVPIDFTLNKDEKQKIILQFFSRAQEILNLEGVEYTKPVLAKVINKHFPDFRRVLGELQRYSAQTDGNLNDDILNASRDVNIEEVFGFLRNKEFKKMRGWVANAVADSDTHAIFRKMYDHIGTYCVPSSIPNMILLIADYSYKAAFVADQEINMVACMTEMMASGEWI